MSSKGTLFQFLCVQVKKLFGSRAGSAASGAAACVAAASEAAESSLPDSLLSSPDPPYFDSELQSRTLGFKFRARQQRIAKQVSTP